MSTLNLTMLWLCTVSILVALTWPPKLISQKRKSEATKQVIQNSIAC